jgi:tryptophan-rich sensory protein
MKAGAVIIGMLWVAVFGTMVSFMMLDWIAGALLVPYLVWVTIAGALNLSVLMLNPVSAQPAE